MHARLFLGDIAKSNDIDIITFPAVSFGSGKTIQKTVQDKY
jgi:hypothetical protein